MAAHDFGVLGCDQPVNPRARISRPQLHKDWDCMDDVAQGRRLDQQNAREFRGLQSRCVRVLCPYVFDLAVQLLSRKKLLTLNAQGPTSNSRYQAFARQLVSRLRTPHGAFSSTPIIGDDSARAAPLLRSLPN